MLCMFLDHLADCASNASVLREKINRSVSEVVAVGPGAVSTEIISRFNEDKANYAAPLVSLPVCILSDKLCQTTLVSWLVCCLTHLSGTAPVSHL